MINAFERYYAERNRERASRLARKASGGRWEKWYMGNDIYRWFHIKKDGVEVLKRRRMMLKVIDIMNGDQFGVVWTDGALFGLLTPGLISPVEEARRRLDVEVWS